MKTCGLGLKILRQGQSGSSDGGEFPDESSDMQVDNVADSAFQYMRLRVATLSSVIARMAAHTTELRSLRMQHLARVGGDGLRGCKMLAGPRLDHAHRFRGALCLQQEAYPP